MNRTGGLLAPWYLCSGEDSYEEVESRIIRITRCHENSTVGGVEAWLEVDCDLTSPHSTKRAQILETVGGAGDENCLSP